MPNWILPLHSKCLGFLLALLALSASALAREQTRFQLRWCTQGVSQCDRHYTAGPSFFKQSSCATSLRFLQRQRGHLEGRCVDMSHEQAQGSLNRGGRHANPPMARAPARTLAPDARRLPLSPDH